MKFKIEKAGRPDDPMEIQRCIRFRITKLKTYKSLKKACKKSRRSMALMLNEMIEHCLKDAGYLK